MLGIKRTLASTQGKTQSRGPEAPRDEGVDSKVNQDPEGAGAFWTHQGMELGRIDPKWFGRRRKWSGNQLMGRGPELPV